MIDQLAKNLEYLSINEKNLYKKVMNFLDGQRVKEVELYVSENNFANLIYNKSENERYLLYGEQEVQQKIWLNDHANLRFGFYEVVMLGFGLSYHLADLIELNSHLHFYIYEPRVDIFYEALKVISIKDVLEHPQVKMLSVGNTEKDVLNFLYYRNARSLFRYYNICIPFYVSIEEQFVKQYYEDDYKWTKGELVTLGFGNLFGTLPYRNTIHNLQHINNTSSLEILHHKFSGCTALVVGAGPSLEKDIELINQNRDSVFIIAAGSAIQTLLHHNIKPHLVVTIDPGAANGRVFENIDYQDLPLAFSAQVYTPILENKTKGKFHFSIDTEPLAEIILKQDISPKFHTTSTVSGISIQIAHYLGASKIVLVGQDLSFPTNQYYASGANHVNSAYLEQTISTSNVQVKNVSGGMNATNVSMNVAREGIEEVIKLLELTSDQVVNASSLGAVIDGAPYESLENVIVQVGEHNYSFDELMDLSDKDKHDSVEKYEIKQSIEKQITFIIELEKNCKDALKYINEFEVASRKSFNLANKKLISLENAFNKVNDTPFFTQFITLWCKVETREYDANVTLIDLEPNMIKKSKLLRDILVPYIIVIQGVLSETKQEMKTLLEKL